MSLSPFVIASTSASPFLDNVSLPSMVMEVITRKFGQCNWSRQEVCTAVASAILTDYGFVSLADLELKVQTYIDNGYVSMVSNQYPVQTSPQENSIMPPKYQVQKQQRGEKEDKFFCKPVNASMMDNASVINILYNGTDEQVCALPNLSCSCPAAKLKCDVSSESLLYIKATHALITDFGVSSLADIYRFLGMFGDRKCIRCKGKTSNKISCVSGTFQCINCLNKHKRIEFKTAFKAWLDAGCPAKHAVGVL
jgi:hypothetical protein